MSEPEERTVEQRLDALEEAMARLLALLEETDGEALERMHQRFQARIS